MTKEKIEEDDILIDSRETSKEPIVYDRNYIIRRLKSNGVSIRKEFLEVGDIVMCGSVGIEVKRGRDLTSSMMSNRLFEQLNNLNQYQNPILAIITENKYRDFYRVKSNFIYNQYVGMLTTILISYPKVRVVFLENDDELIDLLLSLHKKLNRSGKSERPKMMFRKAKSDDEVRENIFTPIKGVSVKSSKKLLHYYGSVANVVNASSEDHQQIDKIGKKLADKIYNLCNGDYKKNNKPKKGKE